MMRYLPQKAKSIATKTQAFTLVELIAALSISIVLTALLLPAIQYARESSRAVTCQSHLRQFGIAIASYESIYGVLPAGAWMEPDARFPQMLTPHTDFGTACLILPELGEPVTFQKINWKDNVRTRQCGLFDTPSPAIFRCPSDSLVTSSSISYRFCKGVRLTPTDQFERRDIGAFGTQPRLLSEVADGLSNTIFMSERLVGSGASLRNYSEFTETPASQADGKRDWFPTADQSTAMLNISLNDFTHLCANQASTAPTWRNNLGTPWYSVFESLYDHVLPPNSPIPDCGLMGRFPPAGIYSARSDHRFGVNVLLGDSGTHFVSNKVDLDIWRAYATIASQDDANLW